MNEIDHVSAVISAAGRGSRMGWERNKLLLPLSGKSILQRTLEALTEVREIDHFVLVIRPEDEATVREEILSGIKALTRERVTLCFGGDTREASTWCGLQHLPEEARTVLIHDGARPFVEPDLIRTMLFEMAQTAADGVICAVPVKDTIKVVQHGVVETTPRRSSLYAVQTPQIFRRSVLQRAYEKARGEEVETTDDAQIVEIFGGTVHVVEGSYSNIKITTPEDLLLGETILREREGGYALPANGDRL
ncbi:MAG: 2-C-methyl-D-erythritol 4-phosphate cytidylyltransferase [Ndongobacter sp.]|nr:2-C-methyl-D-erythritol 4-phosphate cytidylyltransferase [Ndongobacter sp.]